MDIIYYHQSPLDVSVSSTLAIAFTLPFLLVGCYVRVRINRSLDRKELKC